MVKVNLVETLFIYTDVLKYVPLPVLPHFGYFLKLLIYLMRLLDHISKRIIISWQSPHAQKWQSRNSNPDVCVSSPYMLVDVENEKWGRDAFLLSSIWAWPWTVGFLYLVEFENDCPEASQAIWKQRVWFKRRTWSFHGSQCEMEVQLPT